MNPVIELIRSAIEFLWCGLSLDPDMKDIRADE